MSNYFNLVFLFDLCYNYLVIRTITYRLYPTTSQTERLYYYLYIGRKLFNEGLQQRIQYYEDTERSLSLYDQLNDFTIIRNISLVLNDIPVAVGQDAYQRLDKAFKNFHRRVKEGKEKPGFPRFKSTNRWNSFTIASNCLPKILIRHGSKIYATGIGLISGRDVRPFTGKARCLRIVHRAGQWFAKVVVNDLQQPPPIQPIKSAIGLDLGLDSFIATSDGKTVKAPQFYRKMQKKLAKANRAVSKKVKGSANRKKSVRKVQRIHLTISNQRSNFTHQLSRSLINEHQFIAVEDLQIKQMVHGNLAKSIYDASWSQFIHQLTYKAESAGCLVVKVDPRWTSQDCSQCPETVKKTLSDRVHDCPRCGLVIDRDVNAARNILELGLMQVPGLGTRIGNACGGDVRPKVYDRGLSPMKQEALTLATG